MGRNILKNTGRIILPLFILCFSSVLNAAEIDTELSPSRIAAGESATLKIKITGKSGNVKPVKFPAINGLQITFSGSSRNFSFINGKTWAGTVLSFSIYAEKKGEYKIPPFILEADGERVSSREVTLTVKESSSGDNGSGGPLRGDISLSSGTVYVGEPFIMRYFVYDNNESSPQIEGFSEQPHVKGFVMKALDETINESGRIYAGSFCLVPVEGGVHDIGSGSVDVTAEVTQGFFSMSGRKRIVFPYKKIKVLPIPAVGKPDKFTGDVGEFKIEAQIPAGKFKLFEEIKIPVKVSGRGNLLTLSKPQIESADGIKTIVEEKEQTLSLAGTGLSGEKNFLMTVIPQKDGVLNAGRIFIEYFNPYKRIYEKAESEPLTFEIQKSESSGEKGEVQFSSDGGSRFNYFFAAVILAGLAAAVTALVLWERKKFRLIKFEIRPGVPDKLETHPVNKNDEIINNIKTAVNKKDREMFLLNADRGINQIDIAELSDSELSKYELFKEKIYYCRYGGGDFAVTEMNELSEWLKKSLK
jgi:hypothetical protein